MQIYMSQRGLKKEAVAVMSRLAFVTANTLLIRVCLKKTEVFRGSFRSIMSFPPVTEVK